MTDKLEELTCPGCGQVGTLRIETRLVARPLGTFSLAGAQMKLSATETPALVCGCGFVKLATR